MPFDVAVADAALMNAKYRCEACGTSWSDLESSFGDSPIDVHSATSLHLVLKNGLYRVTSTPAGYEILKGRSLRPEKFLISGLPNRENDAFCLCNRCHREVHRIALALTKRRLPWHKGRNSLPHILESVTLSFIFNGGLWTSVV